MILNRSALRYPVALYLVLSFVFFWTCLALGRTSLFHFWLPLVGALAPGVSAIAVLGFSEGERAVRSLVRRLWLFRTPARWYLWAVAIPVIENAVAVGIAVILGLFSYARVPPILPVLPAMWLVFLFAAAEELGWRGFLLERLLRHRTPLVASVLVGAVHALWHWPLILLPHEYLSDVPVVAFTISVVAEAVVFTWLYLHTEGSVLIATLFHGCSNAAMLFHDGIDPTLAPWSKAAITVAVTIVLVASSRSLLLARRL